MFSYLTYFLILGCCWKDGRFYCWLEARGVALTLKPPSAPRSEVSHLLERVAQLKGGELRHPRPNEEENREWNANC